MCIKVYWGFPLQIMDPVFKSGARIWDKILHGSRGQKVISKNILADRISNIEIHVRCIPMLCEFKFG